MNYRENNAENLKIAYIGGGSRGWAWNLMSDLAQEPALRGEVYLYDIDIQAAKNNEQIGNSIRNIENGADNFTYFATGDIAAALDGADFVIISILPGTFDEMESDVHLPEKYGIYQSVGDTAGPGGIVRALRTLPMFEVFANAIQAHCPDAFVINYTNPMTMCMRMLHRTFPKIKAFGCCHEVFGTQNLLCKVLSEMRGIGGVSRNEIKTNVVGVNHFTWITKARYRNIDLFPVYREFCEKYKETGVPKPSGDNWMNRYFGSTDKVKMDLFLRYGSIAAAGDRHLAEFCPGHWYLKNPETVEKWGFGLTPVSWRKENRETLLQKSEDMAAGKKAFEISPSGEEGVKQMKAILGLCDLTTNVNLPNYGQIPNLPLGAVVETNASFTSDSVLPVCAGAVPQNILGLMQRTVMNQECVVEAVCEKDLEKAFAAFCNDALNPLDLSDSKALFAAMTGNTKAYLQMYKGMSTDE